MRMFSTDCFQCLGFLGPHIQALDAKLKMDEQKRRNAQQKSPTQTVDSNGTSSEDTSEQTVRHSFICFVDAEIMSIA